MDVLGIYSPGRPSVQVLDDITIVHVLLGDKRSIVFFVWCVQWDFGNLRRYLEVLVGGTKSRLRNYQAQRKVTSSRLCYLPDWAVSLWLFCGGYRRILQRQKHTSCFLPGIPLSSAMKNLLHSLLNQDPPPLRSTSKA